MTIFLQQPSKGPESKQSGPESNGIEITKRL
jgi:hypothetical protein